MQAGVPTPLTSHTTPTADPLFWEAQPQPTQLWLRPQFRQPGPVTPSLAGSQRAIFLEQLLNSHTLTVKPPTSLCMRSGTRMI